MGTIVHDHIVITFHDYPSDVQEMSNYLTENFPTTSYGPIQSLTNGFVTFGVTTSGSKMGFDTHSEYSIKLQNLIEFINTFHAEFIHLKYGDCGDAPAWISDCTEILKQERYVDGDWS